MFEAAELGHTVDKAQYDQALPGLREALLDAQFDLASAGRPFPVIIIIAGMDGAGKSATVNTLNEWMDPRHIQTHGLSEPSEEEQERPHMWRFWRQLPPAGKMGIFDSCWYNWPIMERAAGRIKGARMDQSLERIARFEKMLIDEGALIIKFWLHLSKANQKKCLKKLESDPLTRWRVSPQDWKHFAKYEHYRDAAQRALANTSTGEAPWTVVEATDSRYVRLTVGTVLLERLRSRIERQSQPVPPAPPAPAPYTASVDGRTLLGALDLSQRLARPDYERELELLQGRLNQLTRTKAFRQHNVVLVFEGVDAAGKGGGIRRLTQAMDARTYNIFPTAAPTEEERSQPYLWRFWRNLPRQGQVAIFDRSWYGRVLVERVEGFCAEADWRRAYGEINDFEEQMARSGTLVVKFWLSISREEQLRRFEERQNTRFKRFKITPEDWRNRDKWDLYEAAIGEMLERTSTATAPWTLVPSEDKYTGRIMILKTLCQRLEAL